MASYKRNRTNSKIQQLPDEIRQVVEDMLLDTSNTYLDISNYLREEGYDVSKSSIGRYAIKTNSAIRKLEEAQQQTKMLVEAIKKDPNADYTEGAMRIITNELTQRFATAEEEWDDMALDKAARVMVSLSRTKVYKDKVKQELKTKMELAFEQMEADLMKLIKDDPQLSKSLKEVLEQAKEKMMRDD